jgi:hypothetical protein
MLAATFGGGLERLQRHCDLQVPHSAIGVVISEADPNLQDRLTGFYSSLSKGLAPSLGKLRNIHAEFRRRSCEVDVTHILMTHRKSPCRLTTRI